MAGYYVGIYERFEGKQLVETYKAFQWENLQTKFISEASAMMTALNSCERLSCKEYIQSSLLTFSSALGSTPNDILTMNYAPEAFGLKISENFIRLRVDSFK